MIAAHGNGTPQSDASEAAAIRRVFGESAPPATAFKWAFGHLIAAAGIIEAVLALEACASTSCPVSHVCCCRPRLRGSARRRRASIAARRRGARPLPRFCRNECGAVATRRELTQRHGGRPRGDSRCRNPVRYRYSRDRAHRAPALRNRTRRPPSLLHHSGARRERRGRRTCSEPCRTLRRQGSLRQAFSSRSRTGEIEPGDFRSRAMLMVRPAWP